MNLALFPAVEPKRVGTYVSAQERARLALACRIYVSRQPVTAEGAIGLAREVGRQLKAFYDRQLVAGFQSTAITEEAQFEEDNLDRELIEQVTAGRLPVLARPVKNGTFNLAALRRCQAPNVSGSK